MPEADARLVAALTESSGRPVTLRDLVHDYDWINRAVPTFEELSFGMPRIVAAGYAMVGTSRSGELVFRATPEALRLRRAASGNPVDAIATALEAGGAGEDRSLGRLPGLTQEGFDAAVAAHGAWVARWSRPFVVVARLLARWRSRRR